MKRFYYAVCIIICLSFFLKTFAQCTGGGELLIGFTDQTNLTFDLDITTEEYCWDGIYSGYLPISDFAFSEDGRLV